MKKRMILPLATAASLLLTLILVGTAAAAQPAPFLGTWYSTDTDGSNQTLHIGGGPGNVFRVAYFDDGATVCGFDEEGNFLTGATARGWLGAPGLTLLGYLPVYCQFAPPTLYSPAAYMELTYDPGTDTFTDIYGVVWTR